MEEEEEEEEEARDAAARRRTELMDHLIAADDRFVPIVCLYIAHTGSLRTLEDRPLSIACAWEARRSPCRTMIWKTVSHGTRDLGGQGGSNT